MAVRLNVPTGARPPLITEKIAVFDTLRAEFESCFAYVAAMHGQKRFPEVPVGSTVLYLHALWICDCKDHLLSVRRTTGRYEGQHCLELLRDWQHGETAAVVAFLQVKLDLVDFAALTRQRQEAISAGNTMLAERLSHGRSTLMDRGWNLHTALETIFALPDDELMRQVRAACARYKHTPEEIPEQLAVFNSPVYSCVPHPYLAWYNMTLMNILGMRVMADPADLPGHRTAAVAAPSPPAPPYAQEVIAGELDLSSMRHNNPANLGLTNPPPAADSSL